jgi:hypothetical protein
MSAIGCVAMFSSHLLELRLSERRLAAQVGEIIVRPRMVDPSLLRFLRCFSLRQGSHEANQRVTYSLLDRIFSRALEVQAQLRTKGGGPHQRPKSARNGFHSRPWTCLSISLCTAMPGA